MVRGINRANQVTDRVDDELREIRRGEAAVKGEHWLKKKYERKLEKGGKVAAGHGIFDSDGCLFPDREQFWRQIPPYSRQRDDSGYLSGIGCPVSERTND